MKMMFYCGKEPMDKKSLLEFNEDNVYKKIKLEYDSYKKFYRAPMANKHSDSKKFYEDRFLSDFNSQDFRCDEFIKNHEGKHILFLGCSETQGCCQKLEDSWAWILHNKIKQYEKTSGYFNLGTIGHGVQMQIILLMEYISSYGPPDEIYLLAPETARSFIRTDKDFISRNMRGDNQASKTILYDEKDFLDAFGNVFLSLVFLENFCKFSGIKLIWSTWFEKEEDIFDMIGFDSFLNLNNKNSLKILLNNFHKYEDKTKSMEENLLKPDQHKGVVFHKYWADKFYERRENEKNNKKN
jgi:hypothetical protein